MFLPPAARLQLNLAAVRAGFWPASTSRTTRFRALLRSPVAAAANLPEIAPTVRAIRSGPSRLWPVAGSVSRPFPPIGSTRFVREWKRAGTSRKPPPTAADQRPAFGARPESAHPSIPPPHFIAAVERGAMPQQPLARPEPEIPPARPVFADDPPRFLLLEREVESSTARRCWPRCKARWMPSPSRPGVRRLYVRDAARRCAAKIHGRFPGWRVADACMLPCRVTAAGLAAMSAALGSAEGRTRPHQWRVGPFAGSAGHRGAVSAGGTVGLAAVGCHY